MDLQISRRAFLGAAVATVALGPGALSACGGQRNATEPTRGLVTRWDTDPWSLGSYSALPVGSSPDVRETLADTVVGDGLVFAGEHASMTHPATVQGAYLSGRHAATVLLDDYGDIDGDRVIVIGAGVAGLAAASALQGAGATVTVLEARDRVGGRVCTDTSWGVPVELGAAWVHGVRANPVTALVRSGGSTLVPTDYDDGVVHDLSGQAPSGADAAQARVERAMTRMESHAYPLTTSVQDVLATAGVRATTLDRWAVETALTQEYGVGPRVLGAAALYEGDEQLGGDALVKGGYAVVPQQLVQGLEVRLRTPVRAVNAHESGGFDVVLRSGEPITADAVVVAVPLSILQRRAVSITPLPSSVRRAIDGLVMGSLEKVILQYPERWWPDAQVLGVVGGPARRWAEWYDLTALLGAPTVVGFSAGAAAAARPRTDAACVAEAATVLQRAFA
ncbi:MAG: FAD-dependent oxidoreductase [Gaiellales bacterium]